MYKHKNSFIVAATNIIVICLLPIIYEFMLTDRINIALFHFVIFPLMIVFINIILGFSKLKVQIYQHLLWAYVAFFLSVIVSFVLVIDPSKEMPPGETFVLHADVLYVVFIAALQLIVLLFLNVILSIPYIIFILKKTKIRLLNR